MRLSSIDGQSVDEIMAHPDGAQLWKRVSVLWAENPGLQGSGERALRPSHVRIVFRETHADHIAAGPLVTPNSPNVLDQGTWYRTVLVRWSRVRGTEGEQLIPYPL